MGLQGHVCLDASTVLESAPGNSWQVLHVRSNYERRVAQYLAVRAVEHYLPLYLERVRWTDRTVTTERPLFPGYVFARYASETRITVLGAPGLVRPLGGDPQHLVSGAELHRIREGLRGGLRLRPHAAVPIGSRVRIRNGVFEGVQGVVTELRRESEVVITIAATQQCFSLRIDSADIEVLSEIPMGAHQHPCAPHKQVKIDPTISHAGSEANE